MSTHQMIYENANYNSITVLFDNILLTADDVERWSTFLVGTVMKSEEFPTTYNSYRTQIGNVHDIIITGENVTANDFEKLSQFMERCGLKTVHMGGSSVGFVPKVISPILYSKGFKNNN